jgi:hypothetical protein
MAAVSGQYSKFYWNSSIVTECQGFNWSRSVVDHAYASCATAGFKKRVAGTRDHSGSVKGIFDPSAPPEDWFEEGDTGTFHLYVTAAAYYIAPAMITSLDIETDVDDGAIIPWTANFGGNGAWSSSGL